MRILSRLGAALLVFSLAAFLSGCPVTTDTDTESGIDFTSHNTDAAFFMDNHTTNNLVAFKGSLASSNLLGGIPAGAEYHGIKRNPALFTRNEAFPVILITEEQYVANRNNLMAISQTPFSRVGVFFNHDHPNPQRYAVSSQMGGQYTLRILNSTGLDVDLRENGPGGATIGFSTSQMNTTELRVGVGDLYIFPVFRAFNSLRGVLIESFPKDANGRAWFDSRTFGPTSPALQTFDVNEAFMTVNQNLTLGAAWVTIDNQSPTSAIDVQIGSTPERDTLGNVLFPAGFTRIISFDMPGVGGNFQSSRDISNLNVGALTSRVDVRDENGSTTFTLQTDYHYVVTVRGTAAQGFTATINIAGGEPVDIRSFYN
jgi:hypothetical protein